MKKNYGGFTLMELMIVVAIIGILAGVGYPVYSNSVKKANRADAIDSLLSLSGRMEEYYIENDTYTGATVNAAGSGTVGSSQTSAGLYVLSITAATNFQYELTATPETADADCGNLILNSLGQKSDSESNGECW